MTAHVRNAYPKEGCGILLGREGGRWIKNVAVIRNLSEPEQAGKHFLTIGVAPANEQMKKAEMLFGISDDRNCWLEDLFRQEAEK